MLSVLADERDYMKGLFLQTHATINSVENKMFVQICSVINGIISIRDHKQRAGFVGVIL